MKKNKLRWAKRKAARFERAAQSNLYPGRDAISLDLIMSHECESSSHSNYLDAQSFQLVLKDPGRPPQRTARSWFSRRGLMSMSANYVVIRIGCVPRTFPLKRSFNATSTRNLCCILLPVTFRDSSNNAAISSPNETFLRLLFIIFVPPR